MRKHSSLSPTIAGAGFVALDILLAGGQDRCLRRRAGGTCGNVLAILSFLGFGTVPIARLGTDKAADVIVSDLQSLGVNCHHIQRDPTARTPRVVEFIPGHPGASHRFAFVCPLCHRRFPKRSEPIFESANESLRQIEPELFFFDRAGSRTVQLAAEARRAGALVMFEPDSFKDSTLFRGALQVSDIVKYSARRVGQSIDPWLCKIDRKPRLVVETMDGGGLRYVSGTRGVFDSTWKHQTAFLVNRPVDEAGAGDWCSAGLIARIVTNGPTGRWRERTIHRALAFGQALAAASILFKGPRGYLENTSRRVALRAALSTVRVGRLPAWLSQDHAMQTESLGRNDTRGVCPLCLVMCGEAPGQVV